MHAVENTFAPSAAFDPVGLGETPSLLILGGVITLVLLAIGLLISVWWEDRNEVSGDYDSTSPLDNGIVLPLYVAREDLGTIAAQRNIVPHPTWVERGKVDEAEVEAGVSGGGLISRAKARRGDEHRAHYDLPSDLGGLIASLLQTLDDNHDLDRDVGEAPYAGEEEHPVLTDPDSTTEFVERYLGNQYPEGLDDSTTDMAKGIVGALQRHALQEGVEQKKRQFEFLRPDSFVLIESVWLPVKTDTGLNLNLQEWTRPRYREFEEHRERSLGLPSGVGVMVRLDTASMTSRGQSTLTHREQRTLGVFGTVERYVPAGGRLDLQPIAVFTRSGSRAPRVY